MLVENISEKKKQKRALAQGSSVKDENLVGPPYQEETVKGEQAWLNEKGNQDFECSGFLENGTNAGLPTYGQVMKA
jgi:hypothetical protein